MEDSEGKTPKMNPTVAAAANTLGAANNATQTTAIAALRAAKVSDWSLLDRSPGVFIAPFSELIKSPPALNT